MQIRLTEPLGTAARLVGPVLARRLDAYAAAAPQDRLVLEGLRMRVPIVLEVLDHLGMPPDGARVRLAAAHDAALFPVFTGTIRALEVDALGCALVLEGDVTPPLGGLGVLADVATEGLQRFLVQLKATVATETLRRELGI